MSNGTKPPSIPSVKAYGEFQEGSVRRMEPYPRFRHRMGSLISGYLIGCLFGFYIVTIIGTLWTLPSAETPELVLARESTLTWCKELIQQVTASFAPILAALIGYLFGASKGEDSDGEGS